MSNEELPGNTEAKKLGYILCSHAGNKQSASYIKGGLCLTVTTKGEATLTAIYKIVVIKLGPFSFPHKLIETFETQVLKCLPTK